MPTIQYLVNTDLAELFWQMIFTIVIQVKKYLSVSQHSESSETAAGSVVGCVFILSQYSGVLELEGWKRFRTWTARTMVNLMENGHLVIICLCSFLKYVHKYFRNPPPWNYSWYYLWFLEVQMLFWNGFKCYQHISIMCIFFTISCQVLILFKPQELDFCAFVCTFIIFTYIKILCIYIVCVWIQSPGSLSEANYTL